MSEAAQRPFIRLSGYANTKFYMVRILQQFAWTMVLMASLLPAAAFVPLGPNNEAYQAPVIGYNPNINLGDDLPTGPKAIGEEYRRNTPVLYYSFDQNFLDYFGSNGVAAVDAAVAILNGITNVSSYSADLSEISLEAQRVNGLAATLGIDDLKSYALHMLVEQMGLADVDRYVWSLHGREHVGNIPCPVGQLYSVVKRNIDPVTSAPNQFQYSSYVNGTLLTYQIVEYCSAANSPAPPMEADAREYQVDPLSPRYSAIASKTARGRAGAYVTGMTRDDIGGLRYLLRSANLNVENVGSNVVTYVTNTTPRLLYTSNLTEFVSAALTNPAPALIGLYPSLQILNTTEIFTNVVSTNIEYFFTNLPGDPYGMPPRLRSVAIVATNVETHYQHTFGNAFINPANQLVSNFSVPTVPGHSASNATINVVITNISSGACGAGAPYGKICTNVTIVTRQAVGAYGDFYILPTNACAVALLSTQLVQTINITNPLSGVIVGFTNESGGVVAVDSFYSETPYYPFRQYIYVVRDVNCPEGTVALRQGVERIRFVRRDYDSLVGQFWYPETNTYVLNAVTNNTLFPQVTQRILTQPDILFSAADLAAGPGAIAIGLLTRNVTFNSDNALAGLAGPGTIVTPSQITFNKVGPAYINQSPGFLEGDQFVGLIWGSFDGSTNAPVVYPNGTSIENLENMVFIQTSPATNNLPNGQIGVDYSAVFGGFSVLSGGTAPFVWTLLGPAGLPPNLQLNANTGVITGFPQASGVYDFTIRMTDATGRFVDRTYTITIP
jgi:hypothetical protein